ncbi:MAG: hypothetical protein H6708_02725 [Kofleriaceae bacterium]|nr:hypothetical protein [Myxococcales bacterium]MCB9559306.1 hypothetical protein [Kofleriaceae bacterium]
MAGDDPRDREPGPGGPAQPEVEVVDAPPRDASGAAAPGEVTRSAGQALRRDPDDDLPVVARLVVEIRSDGKRTVARGGLEDLSTGQRVTIDARGNSPAQLAVALARSMFKLPQLARTTVRGLLGRGKRGG